MFGIVGTDEPHETQHTESPFKKEPVRRGFPTSHQTYRAARSCWLGEGGELWQTSRRRVRKQPLVRLCIVSPNFDKV